MKIKFTFNFKLWLITSIVSTSIAESMIWNGWDKSDPSFQMSLYFFLVFPSILSLFYVLVCWWGERNNKSK